MECTIEDNSIPMDIDESNLPALTGMLAMTFKQLEEASPTNPEIQEYLNTFHQSVIDALRETNTPTGAIPFRGPMTLHNLANLMNIMPDLYDYLKESYSSIEAGGDVTINAILDAAHNADYCKITEIGENTCQIFLNDYIAETYYISYLSGYVPIAFSIDDWYPPQEEYVPFPRDNFWWQDMKKMTWHDSQEKYPEKEKQE